MRRPWYGWHRNAANGAGGNGNKPGHFKTVTDPQNKSSSCHVNDSFLLPSSICSRFSLPNETFYNYTRAHTCTRRPSGERPGGPAPQDAASHSAPALCPPAGLRPGLHVGPELTRVLGGGQRRRSADQASWKQPRRRERQPAGAVGRVHRTRRSRRVSRAFPTGSPPKGKERPACLYGKHILSGRVILCRDTRCSQCSLCVLYVKEWSR